MSHDGTYGDPVAMKAKLDALLKHEKEQRQKDRQRMLDEKNVRSFAGNRHQRRAAARQSLQQEE